MVTKSKDLRTGRSIWQDRRAPAVPHRPLSRDLETDVLVIGAGITGAMVADALALGGCKVAMVDRRGPAQGSTTASTALVQYESDTPLTLLARKIGKQDAVRAWRRARLAVDAIAGRLGELRVPDVMRRDTLYLAGDLLDPHALEREHAARHAAGLASRMLDRRELRTRFGVAGKAAALSYGNLAIDPRRSTLALLAAAARRGVSIYAPADIVEIDAKASGVMAVAANGRRVQCRRLVFATGYELPKCVPRRGHQIISTWAVATVRQQRRLISNLPMIWEASQPYLYVRPTPDGRILCGGEDEDFSDEEKRDALLARKTRILQRKLGQLIPGADARIEYAWTGSFGASATGLPRIGEVPGSPNCWAALGYGGNGTTYARIAADVISGAFNGRPDVDADLYDFPQSRT